MSRYNADKNSEGHIDETLNLNRLTEEISNPRRRPAAGLDPGLAATPGYCQVSPYRPWEACAVRRRGNWG